MNKIQNQMRNIRNLLLMFIIILSASESISQNLGVKAGFNLSTTHPKNSKIDMKLNPGFHIGVTADIPIGEIFAFNPQFLLTSKGNIYDPEEGNIGFGQTVDIKITNNIYYLEVPVLAKTSFKIGKNKIYFNFGPHFSLGLFGNVVNESNSSLTIANGTSKTKVTWGDENYPSYNRFDYGITIGGGVKIKAFEIGLSYDLGLAQTMPYQFYDNKLTNRVIGISVEYKFYSR